MDGLVNKCKLINIVWIDRGIILSIIYYIITHYDKLYNMIIIIDIERYRNILSILFIKLKFKKYNGKDKKIYFYFNIRKIIKKQDVIIDYLHNYNKYINTTKINLVPWYDMNDILIMYKYNENTKLKLSKYKIFIQQFSNCKRGNYNNNIWDMYMETQILSRYIKFNNKYNLQYLFNLLNKYITNNYTNTIQHKYVYVPIKSNECNINIEKNNDINLNNIEKVNNMHDKNIEYPQIIYKTDTNIKNIEIQNEDNLDDLIKLLNININLINNII